MIKCFECGTEGHGAWDCPYKQVLSSSKSLLCGMCDERTRHIELADGRVARCQECHPLARQLMPQHKRCPSCRAIVVAWDSSEDCEHHILGGIQRPYTLLPDKPKAPDKLAEAARQVAESRASRPLI